MPDTVSDAEIAATVKQAEEMLRRIDLTEGERAWAKQQATAIFKGVTDAWLARMESGENLRGLTTAAAIASALVLARDFGAQFDKLQKS